MRSDAQSVDEYLAELPADRRAALSAVRKLIRKHLDKRYEEGMQYGMIGYYVPHRVYPAGYHCDPKQPLPYMCLASQKHYMSLYLMSVYEESDLGQWFQTAWAKTGKKLNMGKCCVRFKKLEDLALDVIAETIRRTPVNKHVAMYEAAIEANSRRTAARPKRSAAPRKKKSAKPALRAVKTTKTQTTKKTKPTTTRRAKAR